VDFFERYPILLILLVIATTEAWSAVKTAVRRQIARGRGPGAT
jgi:hypothetical protein